MDFAYFVLQNQKLFNSWSELLEGGGGSYDNRIPLYSFDNKDVMYDPTW